MKFNFIIKALNSPFDDSAFFMRNVHKKRAALFDCGRLGNLDNSELLDISDVFVTHTHMDHFAGFDRFLRGCLNSGSTVNFYGPEGFIRNVEGRIASYNWNLIRDYTVTFAVTELTPAGNKRALFSAEEGFALKEAEAPQGAIELGDGFMLEYEFFDHGITSVGYRIKEPRLISVSKEKLKVAGFKSGPWLKELKNAISACEAKDYIIMAETADGTKEYPLGSIEDAIVEYPAPQDVTYITDIAPTYDNYLKAVKFAKNSCLLIIESVFMKNDVLHAIQKRHLTADLAKAIFHNSGSGYVRFHHFAPRYDRDRSDFFKNLNEGLSGRIFTSL